MPARRRRLAPWASPGLRNGAEVLVGDVDSGIDYSHGDFLDAAGNSRLLWLWDQTDALGPNPAGYAYGSEWTQADMTANVARAVDTGGHGTHVMGIAGGDGSATGGVVPAFTYAGMAPTADLFFVKTTMYTTDILDGVVYLFQKATALGRNAAVNLSLGSHFGPHDGTSPFESGLTALTGPGRVIVKSAGNERGSNRHAGLFAAGAGDSCKFSITAGGTTAGRLVAIDGYYNAPDNINVTIRTPGNKFIGPVTLGSANAAYPGQITGVNGTVYVENGLALTANGDREVYFELLSTGTGTGSITGTWTFYFTPVALGGNGRVDLWRFYPSTTALTPCTFSLRNTNEYLISEPGNAVGRRHRRLVDQQAVLDLVQRLELRLHGRREPREPLALLEPGSDARQSGEARHRRPRLGHRLGPDLGRHRHLRQRAAARRHDARDEPGARAWRRRT